MIRKRRVVTKGKMARRLVYFCIFVLVVAALWSMALTTYAAMLGASVDLSAPLTFIGASFGGELLLLLVKRVTTKNEKEDEQ